MTFSITTFSIPTFSIMTFSITTFSKMTFSKMTFSIMTFSIMTCPPTVRMTNICFECYHKNLIYIKCSVHILVPKPVALKSGAKAGAP
jgi:hypothetical protein